MGARYSRPPPRVGGGHDRPDRAHQLRPVPGDARARRSGSCSAARRTSPPQVIEATRERWGLDKPLFPDQFVAYVGVDASRATSASRSSPAGQPVDRGPRPAHLADAHPVRPRRAPRDRPRPRARRVLGLETRRRRRPRRQRRLADPLLDAVLPARHGAPARSSRRRLGWFPTFGMLTAGRAYARPAATGSSTSAAHLALPLATVVARAHRAVRDRHALVDHRDAVRGLRHDRPGDGPDATAASCAATRSRTRCCRR